ncbi:MAG: hypothetical protein VKJ02_11220 [Snowella sp.]|nr:hypothetical protein [Snowella sp.]
MKTLILNQLSFYRSLTPERNQQEPPSEITQLMKTRQICPYCSGVLLRHIQSGEVYWRCSYCHQETPI